MEVLMVFEDTTVTPSEGFPGLVPPPTPPSDYILSALDFMHPLEQWGTPKLVSVIAYQVLSSEFHAPNLHNSSTYKHRRGRDLCGISQSKLVYRPYALGKGELNSDVDST